MAARAGICPRILEQSALTADQAVSLDRYGAAADAFRQVYAERFHEVHEGGPPVAPSRMQAIASKLATAREALLAAWGVRYHAFATRFGRRLVVRPDRAGSLGRLAGPRTAGSAHAFPAETDREAGHPSRRFPLAARGAYRR